MVINVITMVTMKEMGKLREGREGRCLSCSVKQLYQHSPLPSASTAQMTAELEWDAGFGALDFPRSWLDFHLILHLAQTAVCWRYSQVNW